MMEIVIYIFLIGWDCFVVGLIVNEILISQDEKEAKAEHSKCENRNQTDAQETISIATCNHPEDAIRMRVVEACVTCERVEHYCSKCGEIMCSVTDCI